MKVCQIWRKYLKHTEYISNIKKIFKIKWKYAKYKENI